MYKPWDDLFSEYEIFSKNKEVVSLTHTARQTGNLHNQTVFYIESTPSDDEYNLQIFENDNADWKDILHDAVQWMNEHIAPHNLVNISVFEEAHPNDNGKQFLVVNHKAGKDPKPLGIQKTKEGLYSYEIFRTLENETSEAHL